jgi:hypothetical protein
LERLEALLKATFPTLMSLGASLRLLESEFPRRVLERIGTVLEASWNVLEASWRLGSVLEVC